MVDTIYMDLGADNERVDIDIDQLAGAARPTIPKPPTRHDS